VDGATRTVPKTEAKVKAGEDNLMIILAELSFLLHNREMNCVAIDGCLHTTHVILEYRGVLSRAVGVYLCGVGVLILAVGLRHTSVSLRRSRRFWYAFCAIGVLEIGIVVNPRRSVAEGEAIK
jgi:hypothetical protein